MLDKERPSLAHLSREELEDMLFQAMDYIDQSKLMAYRHAPSFIWTGRPLPEVIEDLARKVSNG